MTEPVHVPDTHAAVPNERTVKLLWDQLMMYQVLRAKQLCTCGKNITVIFKLEGTPFPSGFKGGESELSEQWQSAIEHLNICFIKHMNGTLEDDGGKEIPYVP